MRDAATTTGFDRDTAVRPLGDDAFAATINGGEWGVPRGPNGGYIAAIMLRAMEAVAAPDRPARSLTLHYLLPPADGEVRVDVRVEREGGSLTTLSARMSQDGRDVVLALGAFAGEFPTSVDYAVAAPDVPAPEDVEPATPPPGVPPIAHRFEARPVFGPKPFSQGDDAVAGGWLTLSEPRPLDATLLAMYTDAWLPSPFARLAAPVPAPTIDLTIHFRAPEAAARVGAGEPVLARFHSTTSAGGYFEEDGELWSRDGVLLAQSRQLALLFPSRRAA
jgi:acyl-CoA thioesterase